MGEDLKPPYDTSSFVEQELRDRRSLYGRPSEHVRPDVLRRLKLALSKFVQIFENPRFINQKEFNIAQLGGILDLEGSIIIQFMSTIPGFAPKITRGQITGFIINNLPAFENFLKGVRKKDLERKESQLTGNQKLVLNFLKQEEGKSFTMEEIRIRLDMNPTQIKNTILALLKFGLIKKTGGEKSKKYYYETLQ